MKKMTESEDLRKDWEFVQKTLPSLSLSPRALIYIAIGWAAVALFFVWLPIVFVYAAALILWNIGRLCSGAVLKAGDVLRSAPVPPPPTEHAPRDESEPSGK